MRCYIGILTLFALGFFYPSISGAQPGRLWLFADPQGTDCNLSDTPGLTQYYVVHVLTPGATSLTFSAPLPPCHTGDWVSDSQPFPSSTGNSQQGVTVLYGGCLYSPIHVLTINIQTYGTTPDCCCYPLAPDPAAPSGKMEMTDCVGDVLIIPPEGGSIVNATLECSGSHIDCQCDFPLPTNPSTWGGIKALYQRAF